MSKIQDKSIKQIIKDYWIYYILAIFIYGSAGILTHYLKINNEFLGIIIPIIMITPLYMLLINILFYNKNKDIDKNDNNLLYKNQLILKDLGYAGRKLSLFIENNKNPKIVMLYEELHDYIFQLNYMSITEETVKMTANITECIYGILRSYNIDYELLEKVLTECRTSMLPWHQTDSLMTIEEIKNHFK